MSSLREDRARRIRTGSLLTIAVAALTVLCLRRDAATLLVVWTLLSVPVGILVGHCALSED